MKESNLSVLLGAAFLMATSAIGPGFLTQTTVFTEKLAASFGFVVLISILINIGAQLNVWRIIAIAKKPGQDIANDVLPGLGYVVSFLVALGGLAFNIGNVAGGGLGMNVLFGVSPLVGSILCAIIAIFIFLNKEAGNAMDKFTQIAGGAMVLLTIYVAITSQPPVALAVQKTFVPDTIDVMAIITLVGGSVGGYITFSGAHRLLDAGICGKEHLPEVNRSATMGILVTGIMRLVLFLAALGVISHGMQLDPANPPASVYQLSAGVIGYKIFGLVMLGAAITSVVGAAYTSVSFLRSFSKTINDNARYIIIGFIVFSTIVFAIVGQPVKVLVLVGALNGLILPVTLGVLLVAANKKKIVGDYKHPLWLSIFGWIIFVGMVYLSIITLTSNLPKLLG
jgi:Mn2+/Fe2+ NRAMP family transporter